MTEESDVANELTDDEGSITVHSLLWHSEGNSKLLFRSLIIYIYNICM